MSEDWTKSWAHARRILCIRLDAMGDVLMTGPAIRALKDVQPDREITLLTSASGAAIGALMDGVDQVLVYDAPWLKASAPRANAEPDQEWIRKIKEAGFDAAVIFTVYSQNPLPSALFCFLAGIPLRLAHCRENPYQLLTHWLPEKEPHELVRHEVRRQLDLVASVGARCREESLSIRISEKVGDRILKELVARGVEPMNPWVVIHPGATASSRRYSAEGFAEVTRVLVTEPGFQVVFTGSADEQTLVERIQRMSSAPARSLAGELKLEEFAALLSVAPLLISNNTGAAHVAAACGTPVVDLYALTNPQHTPWKVHQRVLFQNVPCRYCYKSICPNGHNQCLNGVAPEEIVRAALDLLHEVRESKTLAPQFMPPQVTGGPICIL